MQDGSVQYILDTVMVELAKNSDRKFIYVEIAFFYRWWNEQTDQMKDQVNLHDNVIDLVKSLT